jgi:hypothetical protein
VHVTSKYYHCWNLVFEFTVNVTYWYLVYAFVFSVSNTKDHILCSRKQATQVTAWGLRAKSIQFGTTRIIWGFWCHFWMIYLDIHESLVDFSNLMTDFWSPVCVRTLHVFCKVNTRWHVEVTLIYLSNPISCVHCSCSQ